MKTKDDVLVFGKERIVIRFAQAMRVLALGLQLHQINDIDHPDFQIGQMLAKDRNGGQNLQGGRVAAAGHHNIRFGGSWSLLAHCQMPIPSVQCVTAASMSAIAGGRACRPPPR